MDGHIPWDIRVTLDMYLGGLGISVFLFSIYLSFSNKERYIKLIKLSAYIAPVLVGTGLLFLISELGRPERFLTTLYRFNPQSVTSWGGLFQSIFMLLSFTLAVMLYKNITSGKLFKIVQITGSVFALSVGIYHGLLLASLGRPLWSGGMTTILFLTASLLGGVAVIVILNNLINSTKISSLSFLEGYHVEAETAAQNSKSKKVNFTLIIFLLTGLQITFLLIWQLAVYRSSEAAIEAMNILLNDYGLYWWGIVFVLGLLIPFIGSMLQLIKDYRSEMSNKVIVILSVLILTGSFVFKHIVLTVGQYSIPFFL